MEVIGFIGLGHMGHCMAHRLLNAGYTVKVHDVKQEAVDAMLALGAIKSDSLQSLVADADVVITMVQTGQQVQALCLGEKGIFASAKKGVIYLDCSSIDISATKSLHEEALKQGINMLDAPVSGGVVGAEAGTLTFMVGGEQSLFETMKPFLGKMGKKIIYAGKAGSGQAAKICNNMLLGISMIGVSEAFSLAKKLGLDQDKFFEISSNSSGQCWAMTSYCPVPGILAQAPSSHDYQPGFMAKMMLKDLRLAHHAAESVDAPIPLGSLTTELYELFINQGNGELDFSGIIKYFQST